jgi:tetratricopeptide (TPR) repeat protein
MRRVTGASILLLLLCAPKDARSVERTAETVLEEARREVRGAKFSRALELLDDAERLEPSEKIRAEIYYERGVIKEILGDLDDALIAFHRALCRRHELIELDARVRARKLLECASSWAKSTIGEEEGVRRLSRYDGGECPVVPAPAKEPGVSTSNAAAPAQLGAIERTQPIEAPAAPKPEWPLWLAGGVTVAAAGVGTLTWMDAYRDARAADEAAQAGDLEAYDRARAGAERASTVTNIAIGAAATAAIAGVVYWLWPDQSAP